MPSTSELDQDTKIFKLLVLLISFNKWYPEEPITDLSTIFMTKSAAWELDMLDTLIENSLDSVFNFIELMPLEVLLFSEIWLAAQQLTQLSLNSLRNKLAKNTRIITTDTLRLPLKTLTSTLSEST